VKVIKIEEYRTGVRYASPPPNNHLDYDTMQSHWF